MGKVQQLIIDTLQQGGKVTFGHYNTGDLWTANGDSIRHVSWATIDNLIGKGLLRIAPRAAGTLATDCMTIVSA